MKAVFDSRQMAHDPKTFLRMGQPHPSPEQPERARRLQSGVISAGWVLISPQDHGLTPIAAVHGADYLSFLRTVHARWMQLPGASPEVIPNVHSRSRADSYPSHPVGQAGWHQADMACPIGADTWASAYWSAQSALTAASARTTVQDIVKNAGSMLLATDLENRDRLVTIVEAMA